jgi:hypothetical protein
VYDLSTDDDDEVVLEMPAESAEAELSMLVTLYTCCVLSLFPDRLAKDWTSPIYVFFCYALRLILVSCAHLYLYSALSVLTGPFIRVTGLFRT